MTRTDRLTPLVALILVIGCAPPNRGSPMELTPADALGARPLDPPDVSEEIFESWGASRWLTGSHRLGRGSVRSENVTVRRGQLILSLPAGTLDGGEVLSSRRVGPGSYEARIRSTAAPGSLTAFFLYEGVGAENDEIDIEIPGGSRRILFTVWVEGRQVHHAEAALPFDPSAGFHDYRIDLARNALRFYVDGAEIARFFTSLPRADMHVMANAWWPAWLEGGPYGGAHDAAIEWIRY